jgi:phospholipase A1/A2
MQQVANQSAMTRTLKAPVGAFFLALLTVPCVHADMILSASQPRMHVGDSVFLELMITNDGSEPLSIDVPKPLHMRMETPEAVSIVPFDPERDGEIVIEPQSFTKIRLSGLLPVEALGIATLTPTGFDTNSLLIQISPAPSSQAEFASQSAPTGPDATERESSSTRSALIDKPPPLALSVYEPMYFILGGDTGLNAKFQISLRYQLFDGRGPLAESMPWIDDIYLSYSQTSLWDLDDLSKPFRDSSYRPRLFFSNYDLGRVFDGRLRLGVETGVGHESNGKGGDESRSFNMLYVRPVLTLGDPQGLRAYAAPLIHNYISDDENPTLSHYRGYVDWLFGIGSKGGLDFSATLRKGTRSDYGSVEVSASYPLSKLSGGDLTGWLMLQYFGGYGESLLDFDRKLDAQFRLGIAIAL